jgi:ABC-type taurine transport system ATPase subunit
MLTRLTIRNFKRFEEVSLELGDAVVFVGPNNSGKTTALQALALWDIGLRRWNEKRQGQPPEKRPGVTINRRDLVSIPVPKSNLLWRALHVQSTQRVNGKSEPQKIRIDVVVAGVNDGKAWECGLEFDYANEESFYCRPLRLAGAQAPERMAIPPEASRTRIAFLPPMSGLAANETRLDPGAVSVRLGEGRTAEVLRNLCYQVAESARSSSANGRLDWKGLKGRIKDLFGVELDEPSYIAERGEVTMTYRDRSKVELDISAAGRGLQQTLLLLAYLSLNPRSVLLIDEPDAHLEILRQRQIYQLLTEAARESESQLIVASHSEVILNEAADRDIVVAFVGKPHRIDDRGSQVVKSLKEIGFEQYYQAEQTGWVLYLEGSTDLAILQALARILGHPASAVLERPFVRYVQNQPSAARDHFYGLREAKPDLQGFALFDRLDQRLADNPHLTQWMWKRKEIENYLCTPATLLRWAAKEGHQYGPLFGTHWEQSMQEAISRVEAALVTLGKSPWSPEIKASDEFLDVVFARFYESLKLTNLMRKSDYHRLAPFVPSEEIDPEVNQVLDAILEVARSARPSE